MPLTDAECKAAQLSPDSKQLKLTDGQGMYLLITSTSKYWRMDYRFGDKRKTLALGVYPEVSLKEAREKRDAARKQLRDGTDPMAAKQATQQAAFVASISSFEAVAKAWFDKNMLTKSASHQTRVWRHLESNIFPWLGGKSVSEIKPADLLACLRRIEERGAHETAHRTRWACSKVFRYAIAAGLAESDPAALLSDALTKPEKSAFPTITDPVKVGKLLRDIDVYQGTFIVRSALKLLPLVFVRPGELRHAEWEEINLDKAEWRIPAGKMKSKALHIVPLSQQAIAILKELQPYTGHCQWVFPGERQRSKPISENTVNAALRTMGYAKEEFTGHGFRKTASTLLNESHKWHVDAIERQLAHGERNEVRAAYNYAEYLPERILMMQWWADHLDKLKAGAAIIEFPCKVA